MVQELSMDETFMNRLADILEANLEDEHFGVKELTKEMRVSRSQLHRKLNALTGKSSSQFIREYRLQKAMEMLRDNVATASEIAYRVGFGSPTYFNTSFKEYFGYPPGEVKFRNTAVDSETEDIKNPSTNGIDQISEKTSKSRILLFSALALLSVIVISIVLFRGSKNTLKAETVGTPISEKSIAVLPFKNWSGDPDLEYISDGMTDAVISRLSQIHSIDKVIPFTSTLKYRETDKSIPEIANELGVKTILQGNFQISGDQVKISLRMIDGPSDDHFWSDEYFGEWRSDEIFYIQAKVAENVAKNMGAAITAKDVNAISKIPTKNYEAYKLFQQAEFQFNKTDKVALEKAKPLYERAIALDSNFVEAYVGLANVWNAGGHTWGLYNEREAWGNMKMLLNKAVKIDDTNNKLYQILYNGYFQYEWDFELFEKFYQENLEQDIKGNGWLTAYALKMGRFNDALSQINWLTLANPEFGFLYPGKALTLMFLERKEEAIALLDNKDSLYSNNFYALMESAKVYYYLGAYEKSERQLKKVMDNFADRPPLLLWLNALHQEMDGNNQGVTKYLSKLKNQSHEGTSGSPAWYTALYYAHINDYESVFKWLQKSYERHEVEMTWLREEPLLIPLRNDPRYTELYDKVGFSKIDNNLLRKD